MNIRRLMTLFILSIAVCSCSSLFNGNTVLMQIQKGMSSDEVIKLLGQPKFRNFVENHEDWVYEKFISLEPTVIVVTFEENRVLQMESFRGENIPPAYTTPTPPPPVIIAPPVYVEQHRPQYPNNDRIVVMNNGQFQSLYNNIRRQSFKDEKFEVLTIGVSNCYLTCDQCARLMSLFSFDDEKLNVVRSIGTRIVDRENAAKILNAVSFPSSRDEVKRILGNPPPPLYSRNQQKVMTDSAFESFYEQIRRKPFKEDRIALLGIGVNGNYFTCRQCVRLMSLFSFENEKMNALSIVAPKLVDRENAHVILDSFSFRSAKDEAAKILSRR